jgi:hypothetical protein
MKSTADKKQREKNHDEVLAAAERTRQRCNKLSEKEMKRLHEQALALIYGHDAKITVGGR